MRWTTQLGALAHARDSDPSEEALASGRPRGRKGLGPTVRRARLSLWTRLGVAVILALLADLFFFGRLPGATLGVFALTLTGAAVAITPALMRDRRPIIALSLAVFMGLVMIDAPNPLAWLLFWTALAVAVLSPRAGPVDDAWRWLIRILVMVWVGLIAPVLDAIILERWMRRKGRKPPPLLPLLGLPLAGGVVFALLFVAANPVISQTLAALRWPELDIWRIAFWLAVLSSLWMVLRPRHMRRVPPALSLDRAASVTGVSVASVGLSLVLFNALFAVENGLDIAFLWSGARLPAGVSMADYAHRGAFSLIVTALLAGAFVLFALRPGSATARSRALRRLVLLWVAQNLILVASSIQRTLNYIAVSQLTGLRLAALIWMGLVAVGLVLICWRMLRETSASWLINANVLAAGLVLAVCAVVDLDEVAAEWNVRQAIRRGGDGGAIDLCYLQARGPSAVVALSELTVAPMSLELHNTAATVRSAVLGDLIMRQDQQWWRWTWRGQRRLERALAIAPQNAGAAAIASGDLVCQVPAPSAQTAKPG